VVSFDHFYYELCSQLENAAKLGASELVVSSTALQLAAGGKSGFTENCFDAMESAVGPRDEVLVGRESGHGLSIRYALPRSRT
jgi:hypothetical protein